MKNEGNVWKWFERNDKYTSSFTLRPLSIERVKAAERRNKYFVIDRLQLLDCFSLVVDVCTVLFHFLWYELTVFQLSINSKCSVHPLSLLSWLDRSLFLSFLEFFGTALLLNAPTMIRLYFSTPLVSDRCCWCCLIDDVIAITHFFRSFTWSIWCQRAVILQTKIKLVQSHYALVLWINEMYGIVSSYLNRCSNDLTRIQLLSK